MHPDLEKLFCIAKEGGELSTKQKEIILRKAEKLGEDVDEVEMLLESIRPNQVIKEPAKVPEKRVKCPNCGAIISETSFKCPECGYVLQDENKASEDARMMINSFQEQLIEAAKPINKTEEFWSRSPKYVRKEHIINSFMLPTTKEGLTQMLEFAFSNYMAIDTRVEDAPRQGEKKAWYAKALQAMSMLERIGGSDPSIQGIINRYHSLLANDQVKMKKSTKFWIWYAVVFVVISLLAMLCEYLGL